MIFDTDAVEEWVEMCNQETQMRTDGASQAELTEMRLRIICTMISLLPNISEEERAALTLVLITNSAGPVEPVVHEDPEPLNG